MQTRNETRILHTLGQDVTNRVSVCQTPPIVPSPPRFPLNGETVIAQPPTSAGLTIVRARRRN